MSVFSFLCLAWMGITSFPCFDKFSLSRASRRAYNRLQRTAQLFENAVEAAGWQLVGGRIEKDEEEDLPIIIRFDALYLAARYDGALEGHYHNLGEDIMTRLPVLMENPDAIVKMKNGRLNLYAQIQTAKGENGVVSVELNTVKDINSQYDKYNLVVTIFSAKDNYIRNDLLKNAESVPYTKEDLPQVNPQLCEWLAIVNGKSSDNSIPQNPDLSTENTNFNRKAANQQTSGDLKGETTAEPTSEKEKKSKTKAEVVADNARLREEKRAAKRELQEEQFRTKLAQEIQRIVKEIYERKEGYFRAGSTRRSAELLEFVDKLSQINYSRMLTGSVRNIFRGFRDWFTPQNEALSEWFENEEHAETGRDIMDMLSAIFSFLTNYREGRRMPFSFFGHIHENVEQYFQKEY